MWQKFQKVLKTDEFMCNMGINKLPKYMGNSLTKALN